ncbi:DUF6779 domain-containing protein [Nocardia ignorata]|uniref:DUF6779 domain-containing protein n=1 Tax=Nocardia ignorata TaxID=145285 RepID=A0A4R6PN82_NOCIG|nr:DUF6779 domain-containing protein [Nocardia ignorata]TDP39349.1 hypothetical protein DFR75_10260 [Nocardia ignorata]
MVSPSRSTTPRRRRDDAGKLFIGALLLLGLTASVFLVFSDNVQFVRIGLVAALWAAVIGALAATRYRKDAAVDKAKVRDLQTVYELQLEREINARREYEMGVEARVRAEVGADASEIAALRAELTLLRQNLQVLFEGALPDDQPALQADAVRIDALPSGGSGYADFDAFDEAEPEIDDSHEAAAAAWFGPWQQPPSALKPVFMQPVSANFADPYDDPVTAETSAVQLDEYAESQQSTPEPEPAKSSSTKTPPPRLSAPHTRKVDNDGRPLDPAPSAPASNGTDQSSTPATDPTATPAPTGSLTPEPATEQPATVPTAESAFEAPPNSGPSPAPNPTPATPTVGTSSRRRRRAESEGTRLSVADIMANLQSESTRT